MASLKRRAREKGTGKFVSKQVTEVQPPESEAKRKVGRPRKQPEKEKDTLELSVTVSIGGGDVDAGLLKEINSFLVSECLAGKCSLERGGTAYHLHFQMIIRILAVSVVSVSRLLKKYLGWEKKKPDGAIVLCKKLSNKGLHTFHGMVGYCMKDAEADHFQTVDHNVSADDVALGLEQLALHGQEECKMRLMLTQRNFALKCLQWRRWNYKHPYVVDWEKEFFLMMKTGKYYPCTSWVVGTFGRGYEPHRMQSYWRMLVSPTTITHEDVTNVFCQPDQNAFPGVPRKQWFKHRWEDIEAAHIEEKDSAKADESAAEILISMQVLNEEQNKMKNTESIANILVHTPVKSRYAVPHVVSRKGKEKVDESPARKLWPEEWAMEEVYKAQESSEFEWSDDIHKVCARGESSAMDESCDSHTSSRYECALAFGEYAPVYKRTKLGIYVS